MSPKVTPTMLHQLCDTISQLSPEEFAKVSVAIEAKAKQGPTSNAAPAPPVKSMLLTTPEELLTETVKEALRMVGKGKSLLAIHLYKCQVLRSVKAQFVTKQDWKDFLADLHSAFLGSIPGYQPWYAHRAALKVQNKEKHKKTQPAVGVFNAELKHPDSGVVPAKKVPKKKSGLGKGLAALLPTATPPPATAAPSEPVPDAHVADVDTLTAPVKAEGEELSAAQAAPTPETPLLPGPIEFEPMLDESETVDISALGLKFQDGLIGRITKSQHAAYVQRADTVIRQDRETRKLIYLQSVEVRNLIALALRKAVKHGVAWVCAPDVVIAKHSDGVYTLLTLGDLDPTFAKPEVA